MRSVEESTSGKPRGGGFTYAEMVAQDWQYHLSRGLGGDEVLKRFRKMSKPAKRKLFIEAGRRVNKGSYEESVSIVEELLSKTRSRKALMKRVAVDRDDYRWRQKREYRFSEVMRDYLYEDSFMRLLQTSIKRLKRFPKGGELERRSDGYSTTFTYTVPGDRGKVFEFSIYKTFMRVTTSGTYYFKGKKISVPGVNDAEGIDYETRMTPKVAKSVIDPQVKVWFKNLQGKIGGKGVDMGHVVRVKVECVSRKDPEETRKDVLKRLVGYEEVTVEVEEVTHR